VISDGLDNSSTNTQSFVIDKASSLGIPLFTIAVGTPGTTGSNVMNSLAARSGGTYISAPTQTEVTNAYATISGLLDNGYLLSFASSITDCNPHTLSVTVAGQGTAEARFTRCDATAGPVTVPNVVNQTQAAATTALTGVGLVVGTVTQQSSATVAAGNVSSQNPAAGVGVSAGSAVNLVVSTGPAPAPGPTMVTVPNVVNQTQAAATTAITGAGLVLGTLSQQSSTTVVAGSVISQSPTAGSSLASRLQGVAGHLDRPGGSAQCREPDPGRSNNDADRRWPRARHGYAVVQRHGAVGQRDQPEPGGGHERGGRFGGRAGRLDRSEHAASSAAEWWWRWWRWWWQHGPRRPGAAGPRGRIRQSPSQASLISRA
jgi:hypothetical protein